MFLEKLRLGLSPEAAAREAGVAPRTTRRWRARSPVFAAEWASSYDEGTALLEREALRRGVEGWDEPVYQQGRQVGVVRKYSDRMLELQLRARRPEYRQNGATVNVNTDARSLHLHAGGQEAALAAIDPRAWLLAVAEELKALPETAAKEDADGEPVS